MKTSFAEGEMVMIGNHSNFAGIVAICLTVAAGCSSGGDGGSPQSGQCPTSISGAQGANNAYLMFNGFLTGDASGPDGSARFDTVCLRLAEVPQTLAIRVMGAKPAVGVRYAVTSVAANGNLATVEYAEGNHGTKVWAGTDGTVKIESVARDSIGLSFAQVLMAPEPGKIDNTATGTFTLSGSQRADDVLGFIPGPIL